MISDEICMPVALAIHYSNCEVWQVRVTLEAVNRCNVLIVVIDTIMRWICRICLRTIKPVKASRCPIINFNVEDVLVVTI